jgi:large conductance mechanosensitive channel
LFVVLDRSKGVPISLAQAKEMGVPVLAYGAFINEIVHFLIVAFAVFLLVRQVNRFRTPGPVTTKPCPRCTSAIALAATRCPACCADL